MQEGSSLRLIPAVRVGGLLVVMCLGSSCSKPNSGTQANKTPTGVVTAPGNGAASSTNKLDKRLVGEWEDNTKEHLLHFYSDGTLTSTTHNLDQTVVELKRRWWIENSFPHDDGKILLHRVEVESPPGFSTPGIEVTDVIVFLKDDTITIQSPADVKPVEFRRKS